MCCNVCNRHRKFNISYILYLEISYIFKKTLSLSIVYNKCGHEYEKIFKEEESIEIIEIIGSINNIEEYQKYIIMPEENINQEFRLKKIDEIRNYLIEEINQNRLMSKKQKQGCRVFNYIEHLLIIISTTSGCVSISAFASLVGTPIGITSSAIGLKFCAITAGIKKYKSIIKRKKKKQDE